MHGGSGDLALRFLDDDTSGSGLAGLTSRPFYDLEGKKIVQHGIRSCVGR